MSLARLFGLLLACAGLAGCSHLAPSADSAGPPDVADWAQANTPAGETWEHYRLPGKTATQFHGARKEGRLAVAADSRGSASMLRTKVRVEPQQLDALRFSWFVPKLVADADMAVREREDAPVRVMLAFEGDRSRWSARNQMLSELARTLGGEEMPYATLMYVWCNSRAPESVIVNPRTDRIRKIVVESGPGRLNRWNEYLRNVRADYEKAFGEPPGALVGIAIMSDSDNTRSTARAWYGPIRLGGHAIVQAD